MNHHKTLQCGTEIHPQIFYLFFIFLCTPTAQDCLELQALQMSLGMEGNIVLTEEQTVLLQGALTTELQLLRGKPDGAKVSREACLRWVSTLAVHWATSAGSPICSRAACNL